MSCLDIEVTEHKSSEVLIPYSFLDTGCRKFYPGQWTFENTVQFGDEKWTNIDEAYAACKQSNCGSIGQHLDGYFLRKGAVLNAEGPVPNDSHGPGCWLEITDTRSTYCDDIFHNGDAVTDPMD